MSHQRRHGAGMTARQTPRGRAQALLTHGRGYATRRPAARLLTTPRGSNNG